MNIKVYGSGCAGCREVERLVSEVVRASGCDARVEKVSDVKALLAAGVMSTPALSVDGRVVCAGRVPSRAEVAGWLGGE
ncbi:MAG: TM0996/MTH895 family glutaredoxin-like protein [Desulfovibrio sp.]|nr:TM0996/MTH895 family glutaredoxin-like protein [Desulfovibrio sp.]